MPAYREHDSQVSILNRLPIAGLSCSNGCFENGNGSLATGEQVWTVLSEQNGNQKDKHGIHVNYDSRSDDFLQVGQAVSVNLFDRRMSADVVRKIPCSHSVELCLHDGGATRIIVDQQDVQVLQNTEGNSSASQKVSGITGLNSRKRAAPLVIDIPHNDNTDFGSQESEGAEEKMAAAVLTSLCLSPVLTNIQVEHDEIFEQAMNTEVASDEAISPTPLSDQENGNRRAKLRRRKNSLKTVFQCTWPRCKKTFMNSSAIFKHVRALHLGPKKGNTEGYSDGEEEFYFIEIERNIDEITGAPSEHSLPPPSTRTTSRRFRSFSDPSMPTQPPVSATPVQRHVDDNFIWSLRTTGARGKAKRHLHATTAHASSRKSRGDGKKCRKVFGMEHRHLWCTQCRWKKACVRFVD